MRASAWQQAKVAVVKGIPMNTTGYLGIKEDRGKEEEEEEDAEVEEEEEEDEVSA